MLIVDRRETKLKFPRNTELRPFLVMESALLAFVRHIMPSLATCQWL